MELWSAMAAAGIWPALPATGFWCCLEPLGVGGSRRWSPVARWGVASAVGLAVWSLPMLLAAELGFYRAWVMGLVGWAVVLAWLLRRQLLRRRARPGDPRLRGRWDRWEVGLTVGLLAAAGLLWGFPSESILGGIDQGVYSNVGVFLERQGHLKAPLPSHGLDDPVPALEPIPGFRKDVSDDGESAHLTPQFAHLFPVWLAQAQGTLGIAGLLRLNGLLALVALSCFYATALMLVGRPVAVLATLFLAFNPGQLWVSRITLSETLAQVLIWGALALLVRLDGRQATTTSRWGGLLIGLVAMARVDGFVLLPLIFLAHGALKVFGRTASTVASRGPAPIDPWPAFYQTAIPTFFAAAASYALGSPFYLQGMTPYLIPVGGVALIALYPVLAWTPRLGDSMRRLARPRQLRLAAVALLVVVSFWAYWLRPIPQPSPEEQAQWAAAEAAAIAEGKPLPVPEGGDPDWGRNTFSNLGSYLSPWVLALAVLGVGRALWQALSSRLRSGLLLFFVVWGGFTVAYLYDPAVDPLHLWAVRRFVPLVLPGCVLAAAYGWRYGVRRLPLRLRAPAAAVVVLYLVAHTVWVSGPLAFFARDRGVTEQLRVVADHLPDDQVVLVPTLRRGWALWQTPLHFVFQRRLHPFDTSSSHRLQRVVAWMHRQRQAGQPVYLLTERDAFPQDCCPNKEVVGSFAIRRQVLQATYWPVPRIIERSELWLDIYRLPPVQPARVTGPPDD